MMRSEISKRHKPEDMLLRVIRAAEILVKGQDDGTILTAYPESIDEQPSTAVRSEHVQKTQT